MSRESSAEIPRIIWIMWLQGFDSAPPLVRECLHSWQRHNQNWRIVLLDEQNLREYVNLDEIIGSHRQTISIQALSNVVRINLLARFGGVWVDATCFCCKPLDEWIHDCLASGFFAFARAGRDRLLSSWFLASSEDCHLTRGYCREVNRYWSRNRFPHQNTRAGRRIIKTIGKILNRRARTAALWVHPLTARLLRLHPYHWFHYLFCRLITRDERSRELWRRTPKISADLPHRLLFAGLLNPVTDAIKTIISARKDPLYKLNWRFDKSAPQGSILDCLLHSHECVARSATGQEDSDLLAHTVPRSDP